MWACLRARTAVADDYKPYNNFILFGDSITQFGFDGSLHGWASQLSQRYVRKLDILNRGFSGYTTRDAVRLLPRILPPPAPHSPQTHLLFLFFGANDATLPGDRQHIPLDEYQRNLRQLVATVQSRSSVTVPVLITPPPLATQQWKDHNRGHQNRTFDHTRQYAEAARDVAVNLDLAYIDLWSLIMDKVDPVGEKGPGLEDFLQDGLHLSALGQQALYLGVVDCIEARFPHLAAKQLADVLT